MSADTVNKQFPLIAGSGGPARVYLVPPTGETWKISSIKFMPNETSAAHASNYASLQAFRGASTALTAARTTADGGGGALTQGTINSLALTATGGDLEISAAEPFSFRVAQVSSGVAVAGTVIATFDRMRF